MPRNVVVTDKAIPAALRRRFGTISSADRQGLFRKEQASALRSLSRAYRADLRVLLGREGVQEHKALRKRLAGSARSVRRREMDKVLCRIGFDRQRAQRLRDAYGQAISRVFDDATLSLPIRDRLPLRCSPWVEYRAPFDGEFFVPQLQTRGDVNAPVVTRYTNRLTGDLGSRVQAGVDGAGDDDGLDADYYTAFRTFHTTLGTGALDISLEFEIDEERLSGDVDDEWGWSNAQVRQTGLACVRVMTVAQADRSAVTTIINHMQSTWGDDITWLKGGNPGDAHSYRFRIDTVYPQGTIVILEAGIRNYAWFETNDMSIDMTADVHLRLDRLRVRSCP